MRRFPALATLALFACIVPSTLAAALSLLIVIRVIAECAMTTHVMRAAFESCGLLESNPAVLALAAEQER